MKTDEEILHTPIIDLDKEERKRLVKLLKEKGLPLIILDEKGLTK